jgi:hypothetical protein
MDKSIHDIPLALLLVDPKRVIVRDTITNWHLPYRLSPTNGDQLAAVALSGAEHEPSDGLPPAEADASVRVDIETDQSKTVEVEFVSSWFGLAGQARDRLRELKKTFALRSLDNCVARKIVRPFELTAGYDADEARIAHIVATRPDGTKLEILANLLSRRRKDGWQRDVRPWVRLKSSEDITTLPTGDADALKSAFLEVLEGVISSQGASDCICSPPSPIGHEMSVRVHDIARQVRDRFAETYPSTRLVEAGRAQALSRILPPHCFRHQNQMG